MLLGAKAHRGALPGAPSSGGPRLRRSRSSLPSIDFYQPAAGQQQQQQTGMEGYSEVLDLHPVAEELNDDNEHVGRCGPFWCELACSSVQCCICLRRVCGRRLS